MKSLPPRFYLCIGLLLGANVTFSHAASVGVSPGVGVGGSAGAYSATSNVGTFSGAAFNSGFTTNVGGRAVTMPASMRMAANAGQFAVNAIRLNPTALVGTAVAAWLLTYGIEYIDGLFQKRGSPSDIGNCTGSGLPTGYTWAGGSNFSLEACAANIKPKLQAAYPTWTIGSYSLSGSTIRWNVNNNSGYSDTWNVGTWTKTGVKPGDLTPAKETDWAAANAATLPDAVAGDLAHAGVPLPLQNPDFSQDYYDVPLSDPYIDPVTGKRYRDEARVTPDDAGNRADVQITKQEVEEDGTPAEDPETGQEKAPEEQTDFCRKNPTVLACLETGEPEDVDLETKTTPVSITPDAGWGASGASCPADLTYTTKKGILVKLSWSPVCQMANTFRPIVIGMAWLTAVMLFMGISRRVS